MGKKLWDDFFDGPFDATEEERKQNKRIWKWSFKWASIILLFRYIGIPILVVLFIILLDFLFG